MNSNTCSKDYLRAYISPLLSDKLDYINGLVNIIFTYIRGNLLLLSSNDNLITLDLNENVLENTNTGIKLPRSQECVCMFDNYIMIYRGPYLNHLINIDTREAGFRLETRLHIAVPSDMKYIPWTKELIKIQQGDVYRVSTQLLLRNKTTPTIWTLMSRLPYDTTAAALLCVDTIKQSVYIWKPKYKNNVGLQFIKCENKELVVIDQLRLDLFELRGVIYIPQWGGFVLKGYVMEKNSHMCYFYDLDRKGVVVDLLEAFGVGGGMLHDFWCVNNIIGISKYSDKVMTVDISGTRKPSEQTMEVLKQNIKIKKRNCHHTHYLTHAENALASNF